MSPIPDKPDGSGTARKRRSELLTPFYVAYALAADSLTQYMDINTHSWNYTGYRYVFDPTLPFANEGEEGTSTVDGSLYRMVQLQQPGRTQWRPDHLRRRHPPRKLLGD